MYTLNRFDHFKILLCVLFLYLAFILDLFETYNVLLLVTIIFIRLTFLFSNRTQKPALSHLWLHDIHLHLLHRPLASNVIDACFILLQGLLLSTGAFLNFCFLQDWAFELTVNVVVGELYVRLLLVIRRGLLSIQISRLVLWVLCSVLNAPLNNESLFLLII